MCILGEEVLPTEMQPVQLQDFDEYLGKYVGDNSILALLLDYDGTLSPIAPHPDLATIPEETKKVLERLANLSDVFVGVISGRGVNNVREMVGIQGITYAGNHGLEIIHPDGSKVTRLFSRLNYYLFAPFFGGSNYYLVFAALLFTL